MAARTDRPVATLNTTMSPSWKGAAMSFGKKSVPVKICWWAGESDDRAPVGPSRCDTGFSPSTAANSDDTGGSAATR